MLNMTAFDSLRETLIELQWPTITTLLVTIVDTHYSCIEKISTLFLSACYIATVIVSQNGRPQKLCVCFSLRHRFLAVLFAVSTLVFAHYSDEHQIVCNRHKIEPIFCDSVTQFSSPYFQRYTKFSKDIPRKSMDRYIWRRTKSLKIFKYIKKTF